MKAWPLHQIVCNDGRGSTFCNSLGGKWYTGSTHVPGMAGPADTIVMLALVIAQVTFKTFQGCQKDFLLGKSSG